MHGDRAAAATVGAHGESALIAQNMWGNAPTARNLSWPAGTLASRRTRMTRTIGTKGLIVTLGLGVALGTAHVTGCGTDTVGPPGDTSDGGASSGSSGFGDNEGGTVEQFAKIVITPQDPVITVDLDAKTPTTDFSAKGIRADGMRGRAQRRCVELHRIDAAAFESNKLVPTGFVGGKGNVAFTLNNQSGTTTATFKLRIAAGTAPGSCRSSTHSRTRRRTTARCRSCTRTTRPSSRAACPRRSCNGTAAPAGNIYRIEAKSETFEFLGWGTVDPALALSVPHRCRRMSGRS